MLMFNNLSDDEQLIARHLVKVLRERKGKPISYGEFARYIHDSAEGEVQVSSHGKGLRIHWRALGKPLGHIADACSAQGYPLLPSIVVYKNKKYSGDGFYEKNNAAKGITRTEPYTTNEKEELSNKERRLCLERFVS